MAVRYRIHDIDSANPADPTARLEVGVMSLKDAVAYVATATGQDAKIIRDALKHPATVTDAAVHGFPADAYRIPADSSTPGTSCVDIEPVKD